MLSMVPFGEVGPRTTRSRDKVKESPAGPPSRFPAVLSTQVLVVGIWVKRRPGESRQGYRVQKLADGLLTWTLGA